MSMRSKKWILNNISNNLTGLGLPVVLFLGVLVIVTFIGSCAMKSELEETNRSLREIGTQLETLAEHTRDIHNLNVDMLRQKHYTSCTCYPVEEAIDEGTMKCSCNTYPSL